MKKGSDRVFRLDWSRAQTSLYKDWTAHSGIRQRRGATPPKHLMQKSAVSTPTTFRSKYNKNWHLENQDGCAHKLIRTTNAGRDRYLGGSGSPSSNLRSGHLADGISRIILISFHPYIHRHTRHMNNNTVLPWAH